MNFPHTATILELIETAGKSTYTETGSTKCFLQPLTAEQSQIYGVTFGKSYNCYAPITSDVTEKKRLEIDGAIYGVRGVRNHNYGNLSHKQAVLVRV